MSILSRSGSRRPTQVLGSTITGPATSPDEATHPRPTVARASQVANRTNRRGSDRIVRGGDGGGRNALRAARAATSKARVYQGLMASLPKHPQDVSPPMALARATQANAAKHAVAARRVCSG